MPNFTQSSLSNIVRALRQEEASWDRPQIVRHPPDVPMAQNEPSNEPLSNTLNDSINSSINDPSNGRLNNLLKHSLVDPPNDQTIDALNAPLNDPIIDPSNDGSFNWSSNQLNEPSNERLNNPTNSPSLNDPLTDPLALELYVELEDEEYLEDMALHETSLLQPPPNTPTNSLQESLTGSILAPHAEMEEDLDTDEFEDSIEQPIPTGSMNLHDALADCEKAISFFFNNQLDNAIAIMTPWKENSLYHAHGAAIFEFIPAVLTLEPTQVQRAQVALRQTFTLCGQLRRNYTFVQSLGAIIKKPNYGTYSEEEAHAELVHAEALLLLACLGIIENEDMTGFLRASLRIRTSYNGYRNCAKILTRKTWEDETSRAHFESGVRLGLATFNVMIAMLPPRIVALLEFVGFSANKEKGKEELLKASQSLGLRSVLCELTLLVYYLVIGHFAAIPPDFNAAEKIIYKALNKYPDSVWFLMFKARAHLLQGRILESVETYQKTCCMKNLWPQLKHLAYWELVWAFAMLGRWTNAAEYAELLERDSKWSRTIYMYAQGAMLIETAPHSVKERKYIDELLTNASNYKQRLLGRSLPMEKFVLRRCERWAKRGNLVLPGIEWLYLWNIFPSLAAEQKHADLILRVIEKTISKIDNVLNKKKPNEDTQDTPEYDLDDRALTEFLHGSLLAAMSLPYQAMRSLESVLAMKEQIQEHTFLLPYATVEIAFCHYQLGDSLRAIELLQDARKKYSGYLLESRLHFRIHSKLEFIRAGIKYNDIVKKADKITISGADIIAARKAKVLPNPDTDSNSDWNSAPNAKPGKSSKKNNQKGQNSNINGSSNSSSSVMSSSANTIIGPNSKLIPSSGKNVTHASNTKTNAGQKSNTNTDVTRPTTNVNYSPDPACTSRLARSFLMSDEPMPSTSFAPDTYSNVNETCTTFKTTAVLESSAPKPGPSSSYKSELNTNISYIKLEQSTVKRSNLNESLEMDVITVAEPESIVAEAKSDKISISTDKPKKQK